MRLFALLLLPALLSAEAIATFTPMSMKFTRQIGGDIESAGLWSIRVCSASADQQIIDATRILMAVPSLKLIGPSEARMFLRMKQRKKKIVWIAELLAGSGRAGTALIATDVIQAGGRIGTAIVLGTQLAALVGDALNKRGGQTVVDPDRLLQGQVVLPPWGCVEGLALAPLLPRSEIRPRSNVSIRNGPSMLDFLRGGQPGKQGSF